MPTDDSMSIDRIDRKDILLVTAKVGTILVRVMLAIAMIAVAIAAIATLFSGGIPPDRLVEVAPAGLSAVTGAFALALLIGMASLTLAYDFVTRLAQIIDTVGEGDPFSLANAARLTRMAWLALAIQVLGIAAEALGGWLRPQLAEGSLQWGSDFSFTGVGLALVLFILARVFRQGAAMRDDLEGTV